MTGGTIAVLDTETTWDDRVMSIGTVIADAATFRALDARYHILTPEYQAGGMFSNVLFLKGQQPVIAPRREALADLNAWLESWGAGDLFAYNAGFDKGHLPELGHLRWHDIMRLAAYRQYNPHIPAQAPCFSTGRLKRGYGVEAMLRLLDQDSCYCEVHNALCDALDELKIMRLLGQDVGCYMEL